MDTSPTMPSRYRLASSFMWLGGFGLVLGLLSAILMRLELQAPGVQWLNNEAGAPDGGLYLRMLMVHRMFTTEFGVMVLLLGGLGLPFAARSVGSERIVLAPLGWLSLVGILLGAVAMFVAVAGASISVDLSALGVSSESTMRGALVLGRIGLVGLSLCLAATVLSARDVPWSRVNASGWMYVATAFLCAAIIIGRWVTFGFSVEDAEAAGVPGPYGDLLMPVMLLASFATVTAGLEMTSPRTVVLGLVSLLVLVACVATIAVPYFGAEPFSSISGARDPFVLGLWVVMAGVGLIWLILFSLGMGRGWLPFGWGAACLLCMAPGVIGAGVVRSVASDGHLSDTYYIVAVQHFGVGAVTLFALFAGVYSLYPGLSKRPAQIALSVINLGAVVVGTGLSFIPHFFLGMQGMPRRYLDYPRAFAEWNYLSSIGTYVVAAGFVAFVLNVLLSSWTDTDRPGVHSGYGGSGA